MSGKREETAPSLPTWVEILCDLRQELRALAERVAQLEREVRAR